MISTASSASRSAPPARATGWLVAAILAAAAVSGALLLWVIADRLFAFSFAAGLIGIGSILMLASKLTRPAAGGETSARADTALLRAAIDSSETAVAITDSAGNMTIANATYAEWFGTAAAPAQLDLSADYGEALEAAAAAARRDGHGASMLRIAGLNLRVDVARAGFGDTQLLWKFSRSDDLDLVREAHELIRGDGGRRMGEAGLMAALADGSGNLVTANRAFVTRATGQPEAAISGTPLVSLIVANEDGQFHFAAEGKAAVPLRIIQVPIADDSDPLTFFLLLDDNGLGGLGKEESANINALLDFIPLGLALANVDGRFVYLNKAFRKAAGLARDARPVYPGDLVVDEDKAAVSDNVRRFARGPSTSSDMAVRLENEPDEPVALTIAGARGLGDAAVILSLKDNSEADRLKRQVAQATKMQAVGQLAGGVAHDFNNILTAIIGYCDLMLMRHSPGDSDYDDIQQIRSNSNRAAGLTRQLLAFSRQQTLRPQVLQLPDVIAEVSNLLKRLLGETVTLVVKHGRNLGAVRADPGQLEQVIVNLAVNARDAMQGKGDGPGILTLHTYSVTVEDVRKMPSDVVPLGDYTALRVSDTGTGIPDAILGKIFEPFFTTKEIGKGTGLGLSTVYGIVKQSGGYIFAESEEGVGTSFVIYLPVHRAETARSGTPKPRNVASDELWGSGTILLVEDEAMVRAVAERALTRHGYTVLTAENGEAALEILASAESVDLLISDVVMPTMDGPTTVREARKTHPDLPILFISGYAEEQLRKSIDLERVAFLAKPFSVQRLAEAARDALKAK